MCDLLLFFFAAFNSFRNMRLRLVPRGPRCPEDRNNELPSPGLLSGTLRSFCWMRPPPPWTQKVNRYLHFFGVHYNLMWIDSSPLAHTRRTVLTEFCFPADCAVCSGWGKKRANLHRHRSPTVNHPVCWRHRGDVAGRRRGTRHAQATHG